MSDIGELRQEERMFLEAYLPQNACRTLGHETLSPISQTAQQSSRPLAAASDLPFVTLTYACSLDSKIALAPGVRTTLSGPETKSMTHYLRLRHDAILVGSGTAATDDPGLNCRYPGATLRSQPRPVVVDPNGRWKVQGSKAHRLAIEQCGKAPWVIGHRVNDVAAFLTSIGGKMLVVEPATSSANAWIEILRTLKQAGIGSVMVEGGATVINTLLTLPHLVNAVIITIAPTFLGDGGVTVAPLAKNDDAGPTNAAWISETSWRQFGNDVVLCGRLTA